MPKKLPIFANNLFEFSSILCGLFFINPVFAENFVIKNYDVQINVKENNVLNIKETIDTNFHKRSHGIFRTIPLINKIVRADGTKETKKAAAPKKVEKKGSLREKSE